MNYNFSKTAFIAGIFFANLIHSSTTKKEAPSIFNKSAGNVEKPEGDYWKPLIDEGIIVAWVETGPIQCDVQIVTKDEPSKTTR